MHCVIEFLSDGALYGRAGVENAAVASIIAGFRRTDPSKREATTVISVVWVPRRASGGHGAKRARDTAPV